MAQHTRHTRDTRHTLDPRALEPGIRTDRVEPSYGQYLHLPEVLGAQHPVTRPPHHEQPLFVLSAVRAEIGR